MRFAAWLALIGFASCRSSSTLSPAECTSRCIAAAGSDSAFCSTVCDASCKERCTDLFGRVGGSDTLPCATVCSQSCPELEKTYGIDPKLCGWLVENRPDPVYTPRTLQPAR